jgi:hypothetical protein
MFEISRMSMTLCGLMLCCLSAADIKSSANAGNMPVVTHAAVPLYPDSARIAGIEGMVLLKIETDGRRVVHINSVKGQPLLVNSSKANISTWVFRQHEPASFDVSFTYRLSSKAQCEPDNGAVVLHLPVSIEITASRVETCDPAVQR